MRDVLRRWARADVLLAVLLVTHVVLRVVLFSRLSESSWVGDEKAYVDGARALSDAVRDAVGLGPFDTAELQRNVVASGWFLPGMSVLLTPLFLVEPHASVTLARGYLDVLTTLLFLGAVLDVRRVVGRSYAVALAVLPGLVPMWLLFAATAYGDLAAGLVTVLLVTRLVAVLRHVREGAAPTVRQGAGLGLLAIGLLYLRSSAMPLAAALLALLTLTFLVLMRGRDRWRAAGSALVAIGVFVVLLLPWSLAASATLDSRVVTTTSVPVSLGNAFGHRDRMCFGPCDPDASIWYGPVRYSREVARVTGESEVTVQEQAASYAMRDVPASRYARGVLDDFDRYLHEPAGYAAVYHPIGHRDDATQARIVTWTERLFRLLVLGGTAALLVVRRRTFEAQLLSVLAKVVLGALLLQPFVHVAGSRYWPTAAPMAGLGLAMAASVVVDAVRRRRGTARPGLAPMRLFTVLQVLAVVGVVGAWVGLHVVAG